MAQTASSKEESTLHTRSTDSSTSIPPPTLNSLQSQTSAPSSVQSLLSNTVIPRNYLSNASRSRSNATEMIPAPPQIITQPSARNPSSPDPQSGGCPKVKSSAPNKSTQPKVGGSESQETIVQLGRTKSNATDVSHLAESLSSSPQSFASSNTSDLLLQSTMPRTSSIDSAISSVSNSSWPQKTMPEQRDPQMAEIRNLIATAGSAENLVLHLLREKSQSTIQKAQLWKLVDKQRVLLLGLNKDLERMTRERDRYRKRAKDFHNQLTVVESMRNDTATSQNEPNVVNDANLSSDSLHAEPFDDIAQLSSQTQDPIYHSPVIHSINSFAKQQKQQQQQTRQYEEYNPPKLQVNSFPQDIPDLTEIPLPDEPLSPILQTQPKLQNLTTNLITPTFSVIEATPLEEAPGKSFPPIRKAPPKPLDLKSLKAEQLDPRTDVDENAIDESSELDVPVSSGRGRRKTREEDDRERELAALKEQEARSRSKKEKKLKSEHSQTAEQTPRPEPILDKSTPVPQYLSTNALSSAGHFTNDTRKEQALTIPAPPRSPGLPASPRPADRPVGSPLPAFMTQTQTPINSLPLTPRANMANYPLSPRAPKQPLPTPTSIHTTTIPKPQNPAPVSKPNTIREQDRLYIHDSPVSPSDIPAVYRGLVSPTWPDLLLPPNALPSIEINVVSYRLKPVRSSVFGVRSAEDSTIFYMSVFSRSSQNELWRIEKTPLALAHLDQALRVNCPAVPKLPERKLFIGKSPTILDAHRNAIDTYFEELLDTHINDQAALDICQFLSTDVMEPTTEPENTSFLKIQSTSSSPKTAPTRKTGFLTKKGKNFGGWKARYFVIDSPELKYFEAPGGAHLGTIKLFNAKVGRQLPQDANAVDENGLEPPFKHAILILEPKRRDSTSYVRHILCAENDGDRDEWIEAILHFMGEDSPTGTADGTPSLKTDKGTFDHPRGLLRGADYADPMTDSAIKVGSPNIGYSGGNSPESTSSTVFETSSQDPSNAKAFNISAPMNGSVITDVGSWGNKSSTQPQPKERDQKIRNLFHFNRKASSEQLNAGPGTQDEQSQYPLPKPNHIVRPVFGMTLAEAVEFCPPFNVDVELPAVVYRCIEYLRANDAVLEEGLFRLSGSNIVIKSLKERFNAEGDVNLVEDDEYYDVHAVASLFKSYLRELPSSLLTRTLHPEFMKVTEMTDRSLKVAELNILVHQLPKVNFILLEVLSDFLLEVVQNSDQNKMSIKNVGIVFSPTLNIPAPVFAMFLTEFEAIFKGSPLDSGKAQTTEIMRSVSLSSQSMHSIPRTSTDTQNESPGRMPAPLKFNHGQPRNVDYRVDGNADSGFAAMPSSYEARNYVSIPAQISTNTTDQQRPQSSHKVPTLRMLAPDNNTNIKAKRRESAMLML